MKKALIIMGPPGSGKGTQANLLAEKYGIFHLDTGRFLESLVHNPDYQNDEEVVRQRENFDTGKLLDPAFFLKHVTKQIHLISQGGGGIVFSGSPRTHQEAFEGSPTDPALMDTLTQQYGKENILIFSLRVPDEVSLERNSSRTLCSVCKTPLLGALHLSLTQCPFCGGELYVRTLDKPEIIKDRLVEYHKNTEPVIQELEEQGYRVTHVDATPMPYVIYKTILSSIEHDA